MNEPVIHSLQDMLLFVVPFVGMLLLSLFRLDELLVSPRHPCSRRSLCGLDAGGEPILTDPDGRPMPRPKGKP